MCQHAWRQIPNLSSRDGHAHKRQLYHLETKGLLELSLLGIMMYPLTFFFCEAFPMRFMSLFQSALRCLLLAGLLNAGLVMAQQEPTMSQIYSTAQAGKLDQAQVMLQQVLVAHPKSAKAHFVQAEL